MSPSNEPGHEHTPVVGYAGPPLIRPHWVMLFALGVGLFWHGVAFLLMQFGKSDAFPPVGMGVGSFLAAYYAARIFIAVH